jgi:hypothetical protein
VNHLRQCTVLRWCTVVGLALLASCDSGERTTSAAEGPDIVVFHMTGLLLVVPPRSGGFSLDVLMPYVSDHAARLGIGVAKVDPNRPADFCNDEGFPSPPSKEGICYVDLGAWILEPFGTGTPAPPIAKLPAGLLNVTRLSGGDHGTIGTTAQQPVAAHVQFPSGRAAAPCRLASWAHKRAGALFASRDALVNVMEWRVIAPTTRELVFRHKQRGDVFRVPLPARRGRIELVLAHIPRTSLVELPHEKREGESAPTSPSPQETTAEHFRAFYGMLQDESSIPLDKRRVPYEPHDRGESCTIAVTPFEVGFLPIVTSPRTFSCMMATADRL